MPKRRTFTTIYSLPVFWCLISNLGYSQMTTKGLPEHGIKLLEHSDPEYQHSLDNKFPGLRTQPSLAPDLPQAVLIKNESGKTVAGLVLEWTITAADGSSRTTYTSFVEPNVIRTGKSIGPPDARLEAGSVRLVSPFFNLNESELAARVKSAVALPAEGSAKRRTALQGSRISVSVDGAFFSDGTFVGPNRSAFLERFVLQNNARHDAGAAILNAANAGMSDDDLKAMLESDITRAVKIDGGSSEPETLYQFLLGAEARTLLSILNRSGRDALLANAIYQAQEAPLKVQRR